MHTRATPDPMRRVMAIAVLGALLLVQALGLTHRVLHAHGPAPATHAHLAPMAGTVEQPHALAELFSQHHDAQDCQLFDQLTQADADVFAIPASGAQVVAPFDGGRGAAPVLAAQAAGYLARGPPAQA